MSEALQQAWERVGPGILANPFGAMRLWPRMKLYAKQREIVRSVFETPETYVVAGNQLGKDYVSGYIVVSTFLRAFLKHQQIRRSDPGARWHCRIVTTSANDEHLDVLWAEINDRLSSSYLPLLAPQGPFVTTHRRMRRAAEEDRPELKELKSYVIGKVVTSENRGEGLGGHHAEETLLVGDEASGLLDVAYQHAQGWAKRMLFIGNPWPCSNFFRASVKAGDLLAEQQKGNIV